MDRTLACGAGDRGSNPLEGTKIAELAEVGVPTKYILWGIGVVGSNPATRTNLKPPHLEVIFNLKLRYSLTLSAA